MINELLLTVIILAAAAGWLAWSWWWPWTYCRRCEGRRGRGIGSTKYGYNRCRKCGNSGEQVRRTARAISKVTGRPIRGSKEK